MMELRRPGEEHLDEPSDERITERLRGPRSHGAPQTPGKGGSGERMAASGAESPDRTDPAGRTSTDPATSSATPSGRQAGNQDDPEESPATGAPGVGTDSMDQDLMGEDAPSDQEDAHGSVNSQESDRPMFVFKDRRIFTSDMEDLLDEEPSSDKPTYVEQLEQRVEEAEQRLAEYIKAYKEKTEVEWADMKARLERDMERQVLQARKQMVLDLLEVLDNFTRTIESARTAADIQTLITGVEMIERQFLSKLQALGLEPIEATGATFDPTSHEAAGVEEVEDPALDGKVVEVYRQGYSFGGALLRPALVRVAKLKRS